MYIPCITLLSSTEYTGQHTQAQLQAHFGSLVTFSVVVITEQLAPHSISADLVLITHQALQKDALKYLVPGTKYFVATRTIAESTIGELYKIPEGSNVLLSNVSRHHTLECIQQLKDRGIYHLNFYPYYPGIEDYKKDCSYLVTFGEPAKIPTEQFQVLDFGTRPIDIPSCVKIAIEVGIYEQVSDRLSVAAVRPSLELSSQIANQLRKVTELSSDLQMILDRSSDSVILLDDSLHIYFYNPPAKKLLKIENHRSPLLQDILERLSPYSAGAFVEIDGNSYHVEIHTNLNRAGEATVMTFKDMENIHKIEENYSRTLRESGFVARYTFNDIIGSSPQMKTMIKRCMQFAKSNSTVAIYGESGCGKELIAQSIHNASARRNQAFVAVNFAALSPSLCESELFGYADGAFTGSKKGGKRGLFEMANHGTIFLDEIGDCSLDIQKKILRVIQERKVMPLGSNKLIPLDIRIITATNQDLLSLVQNKEFREDLYYRINVLPVRIPPLSERKEDIIPLYTHFMQKHFGLHIDQVPADLEAALLSHPWRGNVRELQNITEYLANCMISKIPWQEQENDIFISPTAKPHTAPSISVPISAPVLPSNDDSLEYLIRALEAQCEMNTLHFVLTTLASSPYVWSRQTLTEAVNWMTPVSESSIKRMMSILRQHQLIQSKTGYGSYVTELGKKFLQYYETVQ